jgi:hypothetical protein
MIGALRDVAPTRLEHTDRPLVLGQAAHDAGPRGAGDGAVAMAGHVAQAVARTRHAAPMADIDYARSVAGATHIAVLVAHEVALAAAAASEVAVSPLALDRTALFAGAVAVVPIAHAVTLAVRVLFLATGESDAEADQGRKGAEDEGAKSEHDVSKFDAVKALTAAAASSSP